MCWLCQHIYFMSFSHLRVPPSQFIPYSFSLWIHFPPLQDWEHQLGELTVLTRSVLLVQYLHRIYISYETYQFRYISGTMWIKSVISSKILEVLSPSLSLFMVTKLILACAKYISTLLPCTQQLLTAHCCQSLLLLTALPWGLNTAVEAPGNAELKSTNSQFWSRSLPVFLLSFQQALISSTPSLLPHQAAPTETASLSGRDWTLWRTGDSRSEPLAWGPKAEETAGDAL